VGRSTFEAVVWSSYDYSALDGVLPIQEEEFLARQGELARRLGQEGVDAFIAEPGGTTQYYVNFSSRSWELSERPFLMVVTPGQMFFLAPLFEISRARMLEIPSANGTEFVTWAEGSGRSVTCAYVRCVSFQDAVKYVAEKGKDHGRGQCAIIHSAEPPFCWSKCPSAVFVYRSDPGDEVHC
jgi:hypothetical protein